MKLQRIVNYFTLLVIAVQCRDQPTLKKKSDSRIILQLINCSSLSEAVSKIVKENSAIHARTASLISSPHKYKLRDFKEELLSKSSVNLNRFFRHDTPIMNITAIAGQRKRFIILLITTFNEFLEIFSRITTNFFRFNAFFLIFLVNG